MTVSQPQQSCEGGKKELSALLDKKYLAETGVFNAIIQDPHVTSPEILS